MQDIEIIRSRRRTVSISVKDDGSVVVRAPYMLSERSLNAIIAEKTPWIEKRRDIIRKAAEEAEKEGFLSPEEIKQLAAEAAGYIPERCRYYAPKIGVNYNRISIRNQKTRWGSCSREGNLNFNCLLMICPPEVIDSVVVHELCHRKHMDHSASFYREVRRAFPEYDRWNRWLKKNGPVLLRRAARGKVSK